MKNFLLILITCITILFTSCNTNYFDDYEKEETTTIMTRVVQDPLHPIINGENVYGNWIQLFYIPSHSIYWKMEYLSSISKWCRMEIL